MAKLDFRSDQTLERYNKFRDAGGLKGACRLCEKITLQEFTYWRIVENSFPYDRIAEKHDLLISKVHTTEDGLLLAAQQELIALKKGILNLNYDFILEALPSTRSIPAHHHLHCIVQKEILDQ